MVKLSIVEKKS